MTLCIWSNPSPNRKDYNYVCQGIRLIYVVVLMNYWTQHKRSSWYSFLSLFLDPPKWLGKRVIEGRWYDRYDNGTMQYLVDKHTGHIWQREK